MDCAHCREAISAGLDGEGSPAEMPSIEAHLSTCVGCRRFVDEAAHITRLARTAVVTEAPDVVAAVLAAAPRSRRPGLITTLRMLLGLVGLAQLAVAVGGVLAAQGSGHEHVGVHLDGASLQHFAHESAAWNLALGVGFCWVAWRSSRTCGMVPTLGAFVLVLTVLATLDLLTGRVDPGRLPAHGLVLLGLVLVIMLDRCRRPTGDTAPASACSVRDRSRPASSPETGTQPHSPPDLRPTARHHDGVVAVRHDDRIAGQRRTA